MKVQGYSIVAVVIMISILGHCAADPRTAISNNWVEQEGVNYVLPGMLRNPADPDRLAIAFVPIFPNGYRAPGVAYNDAPRLYAAAWVPQSVPIEKFKPFATFREAARRGDPTIFGRPILYSATDYAREMLRHDQAFSEFVAQHLSIDAIMQSRFRVTEEELKTNQYEVRLYDWRWRQVESP